MKDKRTISVLGLTLLFAVGCVQVQPRPDFEEARDLVTRTTGMEEVFDPSEPLLTDEQLSGILDDGLTLDETLRLALVNSRSLQAEFQEIGVAHADWVQSRLLSNPSLDVLLRFPSGGGTSILEAFLGGELLEIWRIPVRSEAARKELENTVLGVAREAGVLLADVRKAYYVVVAKEELHRVARDSAELADRSYQAVRALHDAGAADAFDENLAQAPSLGAELAERAARIEANEAKRELAKLVSIERPVEKILLTDPLPELPEATLDPERLVADALASRLDLQALDAAVEALESQVRYERRKAWGDVNAGVSFQEQGAADGSDVVGPGLSWTLPIFDQNQAQVAKAEFRLEQLNKVREAAQIAVAQDVRSGADRLNSARSNLEFYRGSFLPQAQRSLDLAEESYSAGRASILALVEMQRQVLDARRSHVALRLEAAASAADLERALGAPLEGQTR
jgi:cobalt-zinc-cadmium efflux system outer membrane protein